MALELLWTYDPAHDEVTDVSGFSVRRKKTGGSEREREARERESRGIERETRERERWKNTVGKVGDKKAISPSSVTRIFLSAHQRASDCSLHVHESQQEHMGHLFQHGAPTTRWSVDCVDGQIKTGGHPGPVVVSVHPYVNKTWMFGRGPYDTSPQQLGGPWQYCGAAAWDLMCFYFKTERTGGFACAYVITNSKEEEEDGDWRTSEQSSIQISLCSLKLYL